MSITDELREFIETHLYLGATALGGWKEGAFAIADRIDAEHEEAIQQVLMGDGWMPVTDESIEEHGWVRLPKDANGEYIHIGDVMEYTDGPTEPLTVSYIELEKNGWWVFSAGMGRRPDKYRHHHVPTVKDVLREFLDEAEHFYSLEEENEAIAEYAAKLRLAGDGA